jgi:hypothetical protein
MSRKRTSLEALLQPPPAAAEAPVHVLKPEASAAAEGEGRGRRAIKQQTVYLPLPVYEQLRRLAFDERVKMHSLLMEGLDRVFRDRGLRSLEELGADKE